MSNDSSALSLSSAFAAANRGPLTRIFTPPTSCLVGTTLLSYWSTLTAPSGETETSSVISTIIFINHFSWGDGACYPSTIFTTYGNTIWNNNYYYSPGICPSGWTSACQQKSNLAGFTTSQAQDTTAVLCCPSAWSCYSGSKTNSHACTTALFAGQILTSVWIPSPTPTPNTPLNITSDRNYTTWEIATQTSAICDGIPILWQNTDLAILSLISSTTTLSLNTSASASLTAPIQLSSTVPYETSTPTPTPSTSSESGLSLGAKAAIGVIIPLFFIVLLAGVFFYFRRKNQRRQELLEKNTTDSKKAVEADPDNAVMAELSGEVLGVYELPSGHVHVPELPGSDLVHSFEERK